MTLVMQALAIGQLYSPYRIYQRVVLLNLQHTGTEDGVYAKFLAGRYLQFPYRHNRENQDGEIRNDIPRAGDEEECLEVDTFAGNRGVPYLLARSTFKDKGKRAGNVEQQVCPDQSLRSPIDEPLARRHEDSDVL